MKMPLLRLILFATMAVFPGQVAQPDESPPEPGERLLSIDISEADGEDYTDAFLLACEIGIQVVGVSLDWTDIETAPGVYDGSILEIMDLYYPRMGLPVDFTLRPLHTNTLRVPEDLAALPLDDPQMIERLAALLDFIFETTPNVTYNSFVIGSEFDVYLGTDADLWTQYTALATAGRDHVKAYDPTIPVSFEMIYEGLLGDAAPYAQTLNEAADLIGVSYYPLDDFSVRPPETVHQDFARLVDAYPDKPIYFYQYGYPTSDLNDSSEALQAAFIRESFIAWDTYAEHIAMIEFTWLTEMSSETVDEFQDYYRFYGTEFAAFLGSLGLRQRDGTPKAALAVLIEAAAERGWSPICDPGWLLGS